MQSSRLGVVVLLAASALWAQLAVIPLVAAADHSALPSLAAIVAGVASIVVALAGWSVSGARPRLGIALVLAAFPCSLGAFGLIAGTRALARFDAPARLIAAATAVGFVAVTLAWAQSLAARAVTTVARLEDAPARPPPPPLRAAAFTLVSAVAVLVAIVAPSVIAARATITRADRLGGAPLARAREALTSTGALAIALVVVLAGGSAIVRGRAARRRRTTRALAYLVWGVAVLGLKLLLDRLR